MLGGGGLILSYFFLLFSFLYLYLLPPPPLAPLACPVFPNPALHQPFLTGYASQEGSDSDSTRAESGGLYYTLAHKPSHNCAFWHRNKTVPWMTNHIAHKPSFTDTGRHTWTSQPWGSSPKHAAWASQPTHHEFYSVPSGLPESLSFLIERQNHSVTTVSVNFAEKLKFCGRHCLEAVLGRCCMYLILNAKCLWQFERSILTHSLGRLRTSDHDLSSDIDGVTAT